ncbi:hypothetical protein CVT24_003107 [Panaeolus cyanescens]|uniref:Signal peptidase complex catalytic subunit SEC11 n=1 Tax=Panaeolus cyanescens TaxID=181874 RepID=A0A409YXW0_9AGAR|nr:hypothetical protein CVT24_003107 [Panaeolus cyanescens]
MFTEELKAFKRLGVRHILLQVLNFASVIASGLMIWKGLGIITNSESPIVVVLSGSMEPAFYRGDLLFLTNPVNERYQTGDITVYKIPGDEIPIVHRVLETHDVQPKKSKSKATAEPIDPTSQPLPKQLMLTKGDNNPLDDIVLYKGLDWLERKHIIGKVRGFIPYVGYVTIAMTTQSVIFEITMFTEELKAFKRLGVRHLLLQVLNFASVIASGLMIWKGLGIITNSESPIVVVLSGSMEPAFYRGDLLFLTNPPNERYQTGDITVYKIPGADIPIVHRVLETHDVQPKKSKSKKNKAAAESTEPAPQSPPKQLMLTKGDNNHVDDIELYQGLEWLERKHIVGKVRGFLPYVGYVTIAMNDFPQLKYALLGGLGLLALIQRE